MTPDSVPQSLNVRCPACRNRFPAEAPAWGRTVPCPQCGSPCDVPVPLGVDIAPQWMTDAEKEAAPQPPEPVLDVGLKGDSSDAIPSPESQRTAGPSESPGVLWSETGTSSSTPTDSRSAPGRRGRSSPGRSRRSSGGSASDVDEGDLIESDDDDLLADIRAVARQSKYAPRARVRREPRERRDPTPAESGLVNPRGSQRIEDIRTPSRNDTLWGWFVMIGALLMLVGLAWGIFAVATHRYSQIPIAIFFLGAYLMFKGMIH